MKLKQAKVFAGTIFFFMLAQSLVVAQESADCRSIKDNNTRLACFDKKAGEPARPGPSGETLSVSDVMADAKELRGRRVVVDGFALAMGETMLLYEKRGSMSALFIDIAKLPRDKRRSFYKNCGDGCDATVKGVVGSVMMNNGIVANDLDIK